MKNGNIGFLLKAGVVSAAMIASATVASSQVRVGSVGGVTGPIAALIKDIVSGRNLAAAQINRQGGMLDSGEQLQLVLADSACDPKAAVDAGNKVVSVSQVVAVIGASCSGATQALAQSVTIPAGVVAISESATAPSITNLEDNDLLFRTAASDAFQGKVLANLVYDKGLKRVAVTYANDDYNTGLAEVFLREYAALGGQVVAEQSHEPDKASYRAEVASLGRSRPDALVLFAYYGSSGITIMKNSIERGFFSTFVAADGMLHEEVIKAIGYNNLRKTYITNPGSDPSTYANRLYTSAANASGINANGPFVAQGYDATFLMALAIERAGTPDRAIIASALRDVANAPGERILPGQWQKAKRLLAEGAEINYFGATGDIEFDANGDVAGIYNVNTAQSNGKWKAQLIE